MGLGLSFLLRCQQSRVCVSHWAAEGKRASRDLAEQGGQRRVKLVEIFFKGTVILGRYKVGAVAKDKRTYDQKCAYGGQNGSSNPYQDNTTV